MKIFDSTFNALEKKLDMAVKRHAILSSNVANQETPNYAAKDFSFANEVKKALGAHTESITKTNAKHMDTGSNDGSHVYMDKSTPFGADGNNVDLDIEMGKLSANSRDYSNSLNLLTFKLRILKAAVSGRGGF